MSIRCLTDERGLTLIEMIVAMAVSSVLLMAVVSASLFVQRYLSDWQKENLLSEELFFIAGEFDRALAPAERVECFADSLRVSHAGRIGVYHWSTGVLRRGQHRLTHIDVSIDSMAVTPIAMPVGPADTMLAGGAIRRGFYRVFVRMSYMHKRTDSLRVIVRNSHDYVRYRP